MRNVLITGRTGFIAKNLIPFLRSKRYSVHSVSRSRGPTDTIKADITNYKSLSERLKSISFDTIVHCAAHIPDPEIKADLAQCQKVNFNGTGNLLRFAAETGVRKFIQVSSLAIFDNSPEAVIDENSTPCPRSDYGNSKLAAEFLCRSYGSEYGLEIPILRIGTVYGPGMNKKRMINYFIEKCLRDSAFDVYNANQSLSTAYVGDVLNVIDRLIKKGKATTYHFVTEAQTKEELVKKVISSLQSKSQVSYIHGNVDKARSYSIEKIKRQLYDGKESFTSLEEGIMKTANRYSIGLAR